jgi:hypothetical protein
MNPPTVPTKEEAETTFSKQREQEVVQTFDEFYNQGVEHSIQIIKTLTQYYGEETAAKLIFKKIISELEKLKHSTTEK